jgi:hypothetical protein
VFDRIAIEFQNTPQDIFKDVSAQVADMRVIVNGWTAGIQANLRRVKGFKITETACVRIIKLKCHKFSLPAPKRCEIIVKYFTATIVGFKAGIHFTRAGAACFDFRQPLFGLFNYWLVSPPAWLVQPGESSGQVAYQ